MGYSQRRITDFSGLRHKIALRRRSSAVSQSPFGDLAHRIAGANLRTDADDTVQILTRILTHIGNITGDLLRTKLGVRD